MNPAANTQVVEKGSWSSLFGCLGVGVLVIGGIIAAWMYFSGKQDSKNEEMRAQWLAPWTKAIAEGRPGDAWDKLTTEGYRKERSKEAYLANYGEASRRFGKLLSAEVFNAIGTKEPGREYFQQVKVRTRWEKADLIIIRFEVVKSASGEYVQDGGYLGIDDNIGLSGAILNGPW